MALKVASNFHLSNKPHRRKGVRNNKVSRQNLFVSEFKCQHESHSCLHGVFSAVKADSSSTASEYRTVTRLIQDT